MSSLILKAFFVTVIFFFNASFLQAFKEDPLHAIKQKMWLVKRENPLKVDSIFYVTESRLAQNQIASKIYLRNYYARIKLHQGKPKLARQLLDSNLFLLKKGKDPLLMASYYRELGEFYQFNLKPDSGLYYLDMAIEMVESNTITSLEANKIKALIYMRQGEYEKALKITTLIIGSISNNTVDFEYYNCKGTALLKTCIAYRTLGLFDLCEDWCGKYMEFANEQPKSYHFSQSRFQFAQLKTAQKDYQEALGYYSEALDVSNQIRNNGLSADINLKIAENYLELSNDSVAKKHFNAAFELLDSSKWVIRIYRQMMGGYLVKNKKYKEAINYLLPFTDIDYYKNHHPNFKAKIAFSLSEMYDGLSDYEKSNYYLKLYNSINDSIKNKQTYYKISKLEPVKEPSNEIKTSPPFNLTFAFIINAFTVLNLFILSLFLIVKKNNSPPNYVLAAIIFLPIFNFTHNLLILAGNSDFISFSFLISNTIGILIPILVYRYTCYFVGKKFSLFSITHMFTGVSFLYLLYFSFDFLRQSPADQYTFIQKIVEGDFPLQFVIGNACFFGLTIFYTIISFRLIQQNLKTEQQLQANLTTKNNYILTLITTIFLLNLLGVILFSIVNPSIVELIILPILMNVLFFIIILTALRSSSFFTANQFNDFTNRKNEQLRIEKEITTINSSTINIDFEKIVQRMDALVEQEIYLNPRLSLKQFSDEIGEPTHHISAVLKKHYKMNFFDFINSSRVNYAINFLTTEKSKNMSVEGIGLSSGFNSRTSMYRAFKKFTGKTPSDFIKS